MSIDLSKMPKLGFGLMRLPEKDGIIDHEQVCNMVDKYMSAGMNYFDTLSANLLFLICVLHLMRIPLAGLLPRMLEMATELFLLCSAGFAVALNLRIGREETEPETLANQPSE